jgi:hypothetical protein
VRNAPAATHSSSGLLGGTHKALGKANKIGEEASSCAPSSCRMSLIGIRSMLIEALWVAKDM